MSIRFYGTVWCREESIAFERDLAAKGASRPTTAAPDLANRRRLQLLHAIDGDERRPLHARPARRVRFSVGQNEKNDNIVKS